MAWYLLKYKDQYFSMRSHKF